MPVTPRNVPVESIQGIGTTILRIVVGAILIAHGLQKLTGYAEWERSVAALGVPLPEVAAALATGTELVGGALFVIGFMTPIAAVFVLADMIVAIVTVHLAHGLFASEGGFELPLIVATIAVFLVIHGPGPYSADALLGTATHRRRSERRRRYATGAPTPVPT